MHKSTQIQRSVLSWIGSGFKGETKALTGVSVEGNKDLHY